MPETDDQRIARLTQEVGTDPPFSARQTNATNHGDYLEAAHESCIRSLAVIDMRLARNEIDGAKQLVTKLRKHLDTLWEARREAAQREVRP